jgi:hypothetical protein
MGCSNPAWFRIPSVQYAAWSLPLIVRKSGEVSDRAV